MMTNISMTNPAKRRQIPPHIPVRYIAVCLSAAIFSAAAMQTRAQDTQSPSSQPPQSAGVGGGDVSALRDRIQQLESQLVDMQAMIGTLQTLLRGQGNAPRPVQQGPMPSRFTAGGGQGDDGVMETQIRALSAQVAQLTRRLGALEGNRAPVGGDTPPRTDSGFWSGGGQPNNSATPPSFGSVTVTPEKQSLNNISPPRQPAVQQRAQTRTPAPARGQAVAAYARQSKVDKPDSSNNSGAISAEARNLYQDAYKNMLRRDFTAAEAAFRAFLKQYPDNQLAGNAQYWLGESYLVRGQYKKAADTFLVSYRKYRRNIKAPDSLLKLAVALQRLGKGRAACSTFSELDSRYPNAPRHIQRRAATEKRRAGC